MSVFLSEPVTFNLWVSVAFCSSVGFGVGFAVRVLVQQVDRRIAVQYPGVLHLYGCFRMSLFGFRHISRR